MIPCSRYNLSFFLLFSCPVLLPFCLMQAHMRATWGKWLLTLLFLSIENVACACWLSGNLTGLPSVAPVSGWITISHPALKESLLPKPKVQGRPRKPAQRQVEPWGLQQEYSWVFFFFFSPLKKAFKGYQVTPFQTEQQYQRRWLLKESGQSLKWVKRLERGSSSQHIERA